MLKTVTDVREHLESERARVQAEIGELRRTDGQAASVLAGQNHVLQMKLEDLLRQIEKALHSLEMGTYGICEICERPIDPARMRALPCATMCVRCKNSQEGARSRPVGR